MLLKRQFSNPEGRDSRGEKKKPFKDLSVWGRSCLLDRVLPEETEPVGNQIASALC